MADETPFQELMTRLQQGDDEVATMVFQRFVHRLLGLAALRLPEIIHSKEDAEDVIQSVFKSFFRRHAEGKFDFTDWDSLWSLLTVITANKCGHRLAKYTTIKRDASREVGFQLSKEDLQQPMSPVDPTPTPDEAILVTDTLEHLVDQLSAEEKLVLGFRLQGCTVEEISKELGKSERQVYRQLKTIREQWGRLAEEKSTPG